MPQTSDGTGQMHLESNCCKKRQTLLQRTCHGVSCCGWWCQAACSILGKGWTLESEALRRDMGTWLLACTCVCTCVCLGVSVTGEGRGPRAGNFTCLTNNILRIDCRWSAPELGQGSSPWLLFTREQVSLVDPEYLPRRHVKLDPPSDLQSNISSGHCILTWSISPALEPMTTLLSYELAFKKQEEAWERAQHRDHIVGVTWLVLEAFELDPGFIHEARLRVQMATLEDDVVEEERYTGQWSEWSQPVCFQAPQRQGPLIPPWGQPDNTLVAVSIFLLLIGLTYLLFKFSSRVKRIFYQNVPSPAAFFRPLYSVHNGNFQTWMGAHRAGVLLSQDCAGPPRGASESCIQEAIALLTCGPVHPWKSVALEEGEEGTGTSLPGNRSSENVLPAGCTEWRAQTLAYLPQEDWAPMSPTGSAPPDSEGSSSSSSDYCALGCYGGWHLSALPGNTQSPGPIPAPACGLSCDHQGLETQQGVAWVLAGHCQRPGLHEDLQGMLLPSVLSKARSWTF
ncbi:interleukin-9 receptor isoform X6 [Piliocolobus tephrosceles]|uniref:interleukin-9 receptor isoform X6 n=1 Tax=Piliocolobus tephrosceles TaxID=591936 RepID=UPI000E6B17C7|nr:interleukin-9 receptor isoform X6 [Piliocolobus tephrosceles]